jgi:hypothetical protein
VNTLVVSPWISDWGWSLPLIVITVVFHAYALGLLEQGVSFLLMDRRKSRLTRMMPVFVIGGAALCATMLHGLEAWMWTGAYRSLGALPDQRSAMLYSLSAMTTYGHADIHLETRWQLMGSLEALNGWILFGLTTAYLFTVIQKVWPHRTA